MGFQEILFGDPGNAEQRIKDANKLFTDLDVFGQTQYDRTMRRVGRATDKYETQALSGLMQGTASAAHAQRTAQKKAMERVGTFTGGNPLALALAMAEFGTDTALGQVYSEGAKGRTEIAGRVAGMELEGSAQAESLLAQLKSSAAQGKYDVLANTDDSSEGIAGDLKMLAASCWVAREVYGEDNPKWQRFRAWLLTRAPRLLLKLYIKYGERFARFISGKPRVKNIIRRWMDARIA